MIVLRPLGHGSFSLMFYLPQADSWSPDTEAQLLVVLGGEVGLRCGEIIPNGRGT